MSPPDDTNALLFGTCAKVITPKKDLPLAGYGPKRKSDGVGADLYVRAAVFGGSAADAPAAALVQRATEMRRGRIFMGRPPLHSYEPQWGNIRPDE